MDKHIYIFHHTDLDGMGVKVLGTLYAQSKGIPFSTYKCGYRQINTGVQAALKQDDIEEIIIGDISVNEETAQLVERAVRAGTKIRMYDHHESAMALSQYSWAHVQEVDADGTPCSGTWVMGQDPDFRPFYDANKFMMDTINDWDTWLWKERNNITARQLNSLMDILGEDAFTEYLMSRTNTSIQSAGELFDHDTQVMIDTHRRLVVQQADTCEKNMYTVKLWTQVPIHKDGIQRRLTQTVALKTGMVFVQSNISEIGDLILDRNPDLDVLMMIIFPNTISWRTHKQLPVSLNKIAQRATGWGGGHPMAAGSTISYSVFQDAISNFMESSFKDNLEFSNLTSPYIRKLREAERNNIPDLPPDDLISF